MDKMLVINDLDFSFGAKKILNGVNFTCKAGKVYGILGLNGAGKTTLFRTIFGYYQPQKGVIALNEKVVQKSDIAFFETENYFYPLTKGIEHLQLAASAAIAEKQLLAWQQIFDLPLQDFIENYSTGMRKKLAFLACILQNRSVLILDEPFNGIDLESAEKMYLVIEKLRENGKIILLSSHILSSLTTVCNEIVELEEGKVKAIHQREDFDALTQKIKQTIEGKISKHLEAIDL
jgi:ABC-2 type transport system ATP-binding protein